MKSSSTSGEWGIYNPKALQWGIMGYKTLIPDGWVSPKKYMVGVFYISQNYLNPLTVVNFLWTCCSWNQDAHGFHIAHVFLSIPKYHMFAMKTGNLSSEDENWKFCSSISMTECSVRSFNPMFHSIDGLNMSDYAT